MGNFSFQNTPPVALLFDGGSSIFALCTLPPKVCIVTHCRRHCRPTSVYWCRLNCVYPIYTLCCTYNIYHIFPALPYTAIFQRVPYLPYFSSISSPYHQAAHQQPIYALLTRFYRAIALFICSLFIALASIVHAPWCTACPVPLSWGCVYTVYIAYIQFLPI